MVQTAFLPETHAEGGALMAKKYEELTFTDDFMFCKILELYPEICRELLELILGRRVGKLVSVNRQKPVEITADGHGVRFDVYAEDGESTIYDVEMQNGRADSLPKRSRYAQGMIDLNMIERGAKYSELNRSYVIYICRFNLFPDIGFHKYSFLNLCREDPRIELGDETEKIYLCAAGRADDVSENMKAFLGFVATGIPEDSFTNNLHSVVEEAKYHKKWRQEYMTLLEHYELEREEGRKEGLEEGLKKGRKEGVIETLKLLVKDGVLTIGDAAARAGMTEDAFRKKMNDKT